MKHANLLTDSRIARLYADVPERELAELRRFLSTFPYRCAEVGGVEWGYLKGGSGANDLLLLSGAL